MRDQIQRLSGRVSGEEMWPDARLLESFLRSKDQAAFEVLVRRHGPMVLGVCRRLLRNLQDIEDAFQATFLVLARRAASVQPPSAVGNWLYGVAYRCAMKTRAFVLKRQAKERPLADAPEPASIEADEVSWRELEPILDDELNRLPSKYRAPIVLCDLEAKSYREAAQALNCPEGTIAGRLFRARALLASRLARRGVVASAPVIAAALSTKAASALVPASLVQRTVESLTNICSNRAATLAEQVVDSMKLRRRLASSLLGAIGLLVAGVIFIAGEAITGLGGPKHSDSPFLSASGQSPHGAQVGMVEAHNDDGENTPRDRRDEKPDINEPKRIDPPTPKNGVVASSTSKAVSFGSASGEVGLSGVHMNSSESTFAVTRRDGQAVVQARESGIEYEIAGNLSQPNQLLISIDQGKKTVQFRGLDAVPTPLRSRVEELIKKAAE